MKRHAYNFAFIVGAVGSVVLIVFAYFGPTILGLATLSAWTMVVLFVLPWVFICLLNRGIRFPPWLYRGPRQ